MSAEEDAEQYEKLIKAVNLALHREDLSDRTVDLKSFKAMESQKRKEIIARMSAYLDVMIRK